MIGNQRIDQFVQIAFHNPVELVERQVDAMIGDTSLRKIISADTLGRSPDPAWLRRDSERSVSAFWRSMS